MPFDMEKLEARRAEILAESLAHSNEPRFCYFGYTSPLAVGENSGAPRFKKFTEDELAERIRPNILTNPARKGMTVDTLFSMAQPLCIGDNFKEAAGAVSRDRHKPIGEEQFRPPGAVKHGTSGGIVYLPQGEPKVARREKVEPLIQPNIVTSAAKKGGGGIYTPGVLFGFDEERRFPLHVPDDYDIRSKLHREALKKEAANRIHEMPFKGCGYGNKTFDTIEEAYRCDQPYGVPREEKPFEIKKANHEAPFRPIGGIKEGHDAYMGYIDDAGDFRSFPKWHPDPVPMPRRTKKEVSEADKDKESFKVGAPVSVRCPQPPVQMLLRNLRTEFPKSFQRPVL